MVFLKCKCRTQGLPREPAHPCLGPGGSSSPLLENCLRDLQASPLRSSPASPPPYPTASSKICRKTEGRAIMSLLYMRSADHCCPQDRAPSHSRPPPHARASATLVTCSAISRAAHCHHRPILFLIPTCTSAQASPPD